MTDNEDIKPSKFGIQSGKGPADQFGQVNSRKNDFTTGDLPNSIEVAHFHRASDVDSSAQSQHHTLGTGRGQSSPGNHIHDGITSPKMGLLVPGTSASQPVPSFTLTGSKGGNVALTNLLTFLKLHFNFTDSTT